MNQQPGLAPRPRGRVGCFFLIALLAVIIVPPGAFIVPISAPQATCDALAPILGCKGGAAPTCSTSKGKFGRGVKRTSTYSIAVSCPEGGGSAAPIWILSVSLVFLSLAALVVAARARRRA